MPSSGWHCSSVTWGRTIRNCLYWPSLSLFCYRMIIYQWNKIHQNQAQLLQILQNSRQHFMYYCIPCPSSWQTDSSPRRSRPACPVLRGGSVGSCTGSPCWLSPPVPSCRKGLNKTVSATSSDLSERNSLTRITLERLQNCSSTGNFELTYHGATIHYIQKFAIYCAHKWTQF